MCVLVIATLLDRNLFCKLFVFVGVFVYSFNRRIILEKGVNFVTIEESLFRPCDVTLNISFFIVTSVSDNDFIERKELEAEAEDERKAKELAHKEIEEMKRKELERLEEERQWKEEQERLSREAAAREAEKKKLEEVRMK